MTNTASDTNVANRFWIQTRTPRGSFDLANPKAEDVRIYDIAYALSMLCRFTGHCNRFYSVAQHSIHVAELVAEEHPEWALAALLHDAEEAYIGDLSSPLKALIRNNGGGHMLNALAYPIKQVVSWRFGLGDSLVEIGGAKYKSIKAADLKMLATERRDLMPESPAAREASWFASTGVPQAAPCEWHIPKLGQPSVVRNLFLVAFAKYGGE